MLFRTAAADRPDHFGAYPLETLAAAAARHARGDPPPAHYSPTPPDPGGPQGENTRPAIYGAGAEAGGKTDREPDRRGGSFPST